MKQEEVTSGMGGRGSDENLTIVLTWARGWEIYSI